VHYAAAVRNSIGVGTDQTISAAQTEILRRKVTKLLKFARRTTTKIL